jgi:uncharacterized membrane protein YqjE
VVEAEIDTRYARPTLSYYSRRRLILFQLLSFGILVILIAFDQLKSTAFFATAILVYVTVVFGSPRSQSALKLMRTMWTK